MHENLGNSPERGKVSMYHIELVGHEARDPSRRDDFEAELQYGGSRVSLRKEVLSALNLLNVRPATAGALLSYVSGFPSAMAAALEGGWNAEGVKTACNKLMGLISTVVDPNEIRDFNAPRKSVSFGALLPQDPRLPKWPAVGPDGLTGDL